MLKYLKILTLLCVITISASAQTYFTPGVPPGSTSFSPTFRGLAGTTDSLNNFFLANGNKYYKFYTAAQSNLLFAPATGGGYVPSSRRVFNGFGILGGTQLNTDITKSVDTSLLTTITRFNTDIGTATQAAITASSVTASNGLTKTGSNIKLGGAIASGVDLPLSGSGYFELFEASGYKTDFYMDNSSSYIATSDDADASISRQLNMKSSGSGSNGGIGLFTNKNGNTYRGIFLDAYSGSDLTDLPTNQLTIVDNITNKGAVYYGDYEANFTDRSLVSKRYVANGFAPISGSANYIQNQYSTAQTADFKINGQATVQDGLGNITSVTAGAILVNTNAGNIGIVSASNGSNYGAFEPTYLGIHNADGYTYYRKNDIARQASSGTYIYTFPDATGTFALSSDLAGFFPYTGATQNATTTFDISARKLIATGTAGGGYLDLLSQSASPASTSGHLKFYSDSLNRPSWKNSTYRRTIHVPYLSDVTIRMPYKANPTLADSTDISSGYVHKTGNITESINGLKTFTSAFAATGTAAFGTGYSGSTLPFTFTESNTSSTGGVAAYQNPSNTGFTSVDFLSNAGVPKLNVGYVNPGAASSLAGLSYINTNSTDLFLGYSGSERMRVNNTQISIPTNGFSVTNGSYDPVNFERANHYWLNGVYNIGLQKGGTGSTRSLKLSIDNGSNLALTSTILNYQNYASGAGIVLSRINGTLASPTQVLSGNMLGGVYFNGYTSSGATGSNVGAFQFLAAEDFTSTAQGTSFDLSTTPIGSTTRATRLSVSSAGVVNITNLTASRVVTTDGSKNLASSAVTTTELLLLSGRTSLQSAITFGTGVQTALGVNIGSAGAPVLFNGAGGTPSSLVGTNITGTASGLTAGAVTNGVYTTTFNTLGDARYALLTGSNNFTGNQSNTGLFLNTGAMSIYGGNLISVFSSTQSGNPSTSIGAGGTKVALTDVGTNNYTSYGYRKITQDASGVVTELSLPLRQAWVATNSVQTPTNGGIAIYNSTGDLVSSTGLTSGTTAVTQSAGDNSTKIATTAYVDGLIKKGTYSTAVIAQTSFTVTIGSTMANTSYGVSVVPSSAFGRQPFSIENKTTTTFDVVYSLLPASPGTLDLAWVVIP